MSVLGAVILVISAFIMAGIQPTLLGPLALWPVIPLALIILGIGILACFRSLPRWLLIVHCSVNVLGLLLQSLVFLANLTLGCFDVCNPASPALAFWSFLGLVGFVLSSIGAFMMLTRLSPKKA